MHAFFFFFGKNWIFTYLVCKIKTRIDRQKSKYFAIWFKSSGHWSWYFFFKSTLVHSWKKCSLVLHKFCLSVLNFSEPWRNTVLIWASMFLKSVQVPPPLLQIIIVCLQIIQANSWAAISKTQRSCYRSWRSHYVCVYFMLLRLIYLNQNEKLLYVACTPYCFDFHHSTFLSNVLNLLPPLPLLIVTENLKPNTAFFSQKNLVYNNVEGQIAWKLRRL